MASEATGKQQEAALVVPEEVTAVLEEMVMTVSTGPTDISVLHDYAMEHLFSFLSVAELKNCRFVNRSWNGASNQSILKRDYVLHFEDYDENRRSQHAYRIEDIPKLIQEIRTSVQFPWTKFKLHGQVYYGPKTSQKTLQLPFGNLLRVINPIVTELEIHHCWNLPNLEYPKLRKLTLRYDSLEGFPTGSNWISLSEMVETASKLNELRIIGSLKTPLFMDLLEIPNCCKITRLSLVQGIVGEHLVRISKMGFQLKFLNLEFQMADVTTESIRAVLESQSNCLEHLELTSYSFMDQSQRAGDSVDPQWLLGMEFPRMEKVKVLNVQSDKTLYSRISYKNMFPALKKLTVCGHSFNETAAGDSFFHGDIEPVETVEYLNFAVFPLSNNQRGLEKILQATRQFPKLRSVSLIVSQNLFNSIGNALSSLEEMDLSFFRNVNMDSFLSGLSSEEVDTLKALPADQLDEVERSKEPVRFLKNLKKLCLTSMESTEIESPLSDFGCRFALLKMEHLQVLELIGNFGQISDQVMERMRGKFVVRLKN